MASQGLVMSRLATALTALALIGCTLLSIATSPALASRPSGHGYTQHGRFCAGGTAARPNPRLYACNDGRTYTYLGGWGCDYDYDYDYDYYMGYQPEPGWPADSATAVFSC